VLTAGSANSFIDNLCATASSEDGAKAERRTYANCSSGSSPQEDDLLFVGPGVGRCFQDEEVGNKTAILCAPPGDRSQPCTRRSCSRPSGNGDAAVTPSPMPSCLISPDDGWGQRWGRCQRRKIPWESGKVIQIRGPATA